MRLQTLLAYFYVLCDVDELCLTKRISEVLRVLTLIFADDVGNRRIFQNSAKNKKMQKFA